MATYRSKVAVTAQNKRAAYEAVQHLITHLLAWGIDFTRIQRMPDAFVEVDTTAPIPAAHVDHLSLTGPVA